MPEQQTTCEAIKLAIRREREAYNFLMAMSGSVKSPGMKFLLEDLAKEELEHENKLELELMKLGEVVRSDQEQTETQNPYYVDAGECADMDYADLLRLCMEKEDISFRLYIDLSNQMHQEQTREVFISLAEEELRHKLRFEAEYEKLPRTK